MRRAARGPGGRGAFCFHYVILDWGVLGWEPFVFIMFSSIFFQPCYTARILSRAEAWLPTGAVGSPSKRKKVPSSSEIFVQQQKLSVELRDFRAAAKIIIINFGKEILGSTAELFHGVCASPKSFNKEPSAFSKPSCLKRSLLSFSPTPNRWKSITKTTRSLKTSCSNQALIDSDKLIRRIEKMMAPGTGGLSGLFPLGDSYLVASTDSVGTKVELASETQIHDTIGIDLVATSVNDIVSFGAEPLYFRAYHVMCSNRPKIMVKVEKSIIVGCSQSNCAIFCGKIEEMPGCHVEVEYCLGGFAVGKVKKDSLIDGKNIIAGDVLVGLPSNGVHCNGFSLVRRVLAQSGLSFKDQIPGGSGKPITLGEALMAPTVNYVQQVLHIIGKGEVKGIAHITSGGLTASIPRVFPRGLGAAIYQDSWEVSAVFKWIQEAGRIDDVEMRSTFNMGIGMVLVVSPDASARILGEPHEGYLAYRIGEVTGKEGVTYQ